MQECHRQDQNRIIKASVSACCVRQELIVPDCDTRSSGAAEDGGSQQGP